MSFLSKVLHLERERSGSAGNLMDIVTALGSLCRVYEEVVDILRDTTMLLKNQVKDFVPHPYAQHDLEEGLLGSIHRASDMLEGAKMFRGFIWERDRDGKLTEGSVGSHVYQIRKNLLHSIQSREWVKSVARPTKVYSPSKRLGSRDVSRIKDLCSSLTRLFDLPASPPAGQDVLESKTHIFFSEDSLALMRVANGDTVSFKNALYRGYVGDPMWMPASSIEVEQLVQPLALLSQAINVRLGLPRLLGSSLGNFRVFQSLSAFRVNLRFLASLHVLSLLSIFCAHFAPSLHFKFPLYICAAWSVFRLFQ